MKILTGCAETCGLCEPLTDENCADLYRTESCQRWSWRCGSDEDLRKYCARTCGACSPADSAANTTALNSPANSAANTALVDSGVTSLDTTQPDSTEKTLDTTEPDSAGKTQCIDNSDKSLCGYYKSAGYCRNAQYVSAMSAQCMRTCGLCGAECRDQEEVCRIWRQRGHCETNKYLRETVCPLSCGTC